MLDPGPESKLDTRGSHKPAGSAWQVYKRLLGYAWAYKYRLIVSVFFAVVVAASFSSMILAVGTAVKLLYVDEATVNAQIDALASGSSVQAVAGLFGWSADGLKDKAHAFAGAMRADTGRALAYLSVALIALALAGGLARFFQEYFAGVIGASISVELAQEMFTNIMGLSVLFFERRTTGEILARFTNDVFMVNRGLANVFVKVLREPIKALFCLALALSVNWQLTLVVLLVLPPVAIAMIKIGREVKKRVTRSLEKIASMAGVAAETVKGILIVKAYCMEQYETARVKVELHKLRRNLRKMVKADAAIGPVVELMLVIGLVVFVLLANRAVVEQRIDGGGLVIMFGALAAMLDPVRKLAAVNNMIQSSVASAERVFEFIDMKPDVFEAPDAIELPRLDESLRFEDVHFSYDGETEVLKGVSFEVKKGEMVALVGFSGAGKSTIVKLIPRFYEATAGAITIDGADIRQSTFKSLRDLISIVTQETILFNESIRDNIAFGRQTYPDERVREAAEAAHAAGFIERMPGKYATNIGEAGVTLSGGQRQRLAIARAIIKDPSILILDEATSSLDTESERAIQAAIDEFVVGRTTLVIAHRLSTVQRADRILVVDKGCIVEQGTHDELMAMGGLYRRLYETQFASNQGTASS